MATEGSGRSAKRQFTQEEQAEMLDLSRQPDIINRITESIAPSIFRNNGAFFNL